MAAPSDGDNAGWDSHDSITLGQAANRRAAALAEAAPLLQSEASDDIEDDGLQRQLRHNRTDTPDGTTTTKRARYRRMFFTRLRYYVPIIGWLPKYKLSYLQGDLIAAITVTFLLVPQGLSYAPQLLGVGPEALISIIVGATIREFPLPKDKDGSGRIEMDVKEKVALATVLNLMVGLLTFLLGFFRLGFLDSVLSRALLRGFILAVAFVVMIDMSPVLLGLVPPTDQCNSATWAIVDPVNESLSPIEKLIETLSNLGSLHPLTTAISAVSIAFLLGVKFIKSRFSRIRWLQFVPEILVLVVVSTATVQGLRWDCKGVAILNRVQGDGSSAGYDYPKLPRLTVAKISNLLLSAILISVIGFVESIVVAKTYATKHNYAASPNRELVAIGMSNIIGSLFGAYPAFGSLGRSAVNDTAGAKTQLSGFLTGIFVICTTIWLLPFFEFLPKAVCSSIIVVAALKLVELEDVEFILKLRAWKDLGLLMVTFFTTIFVSIEAGTLLSVGISLLLVMKHTTKTRVAILGRTLVVDPRTGHVKTKFRSINESNRVEKIEGALVIRIEEGLFFGNSGQLKDRLKRIEVFGDLGVHPGEEPKRGVITAVAGADVSTGTGTGTEEDGRGGGREGEDDIRSVIFDCGGVTNIDASAAQILLEIVQEYHSRNIEVCFVKLREKCRTKFLRSGIYDLVGPGHFFRKIRDAIEFLRNADRIRDPFYADAPEGRHLPHGAVAGGDTGSGSGNTSYNWTVPNRRGSDVSYASFFSGAPGAYGETFPDSTPGSDFLFSYEGYGGRDPSPYRRGNGSLTVPGEGGRRSPVARGSGRRRGGGGHVRVPARMRHEGDGPVDGDVVDLFSDSEPEFGPPDDYVEPPGLGQGHGTIGRLNNV
ncbi:Solute carrier 26 [Rhizophlyctis rosea]|nr:Solute carrier 26 [Rhizophlyctis rosea]